MKFDLSPFRHIRVTPITGAIGAEIDGVDAATAQDATVVDEMRLALARFGVLFLSDQQLDEDQFIRFAECFGEIGVSPLVGGRATKRDRLSRMERAADVPDDVRNNGDRWHIDRAQDEMPPKGFLLYCLEAPEYGGDTVFASLQSAYAALPADLQARCRSLTGIHSMSGVLDIDGSGHDRQSIDGKPRAAAWVDPAHHDYVRAARDHPLVCAHPDTGEPYLFVSGAYMQGIRELDEIEGFDLIDRLNRHVVRPEFTCRFRWRKGSLAVLDNRVTQHYAVNDYAGFARRMLRLELAGDRAPVRYLPETDR